MLLQAVGDDLLDSIVSDNIPIFTEEEKYNQTVLSSVDRLEAKLTGQTVPGEHSQPGRALCQAAALAVTAGGFAALQRANGECWARVCLCCTHQLCCNEKKGARLSVERCGDAAAASDMRMPACLRAAMQTPLCVLTTPASALTRPRRRQRRARPLPAQLCCHCC